MPIDKETIDYLELRLDRIEHKIDDISKLRKEVSYIRGEMKIIIGVYSTALIGLVSAFIISGLRL